MTAWVLTFWGSALAVVYAYVGYPLLMALLARLRREEDLARRPHLPAEVTMLVPVHNEAGTIATKLANTRSLVYDGTLRVIFISDGSSDATVEILLSGTDPRVEVLALPTRQGKAAALNAGLARVTGGIVVFSDASIELEPGAITEIVRPFSDPSIGCVSGEDRIAGAGGEGLYGRYEMFIRRKESRVHSIVGASGSFYAQRRELCEPFVPNLAPDFLSVLRTVERGFRCISEPRAIGYMRAVENPRGEFQRKVRTILRGLTTLGAFVHLLNPLRTGVFSLQLASHKLVRWSVPFFLVLMLLASVRLAPASGLYVTLLVLQIAFYGLAWLALRVDLPRRLHAPARIAVYFTTANLAALLAWWRYAKGERQELWAPSQR